jgi:hypothetical protein
MFIQNKYTIWYYAIVNKAKNTQYNQYTEKHHIIPRCLGGSDENENLIRFSAREHFICHWLLTKMTEGSNFEKMIHAMRMLKAENPNQTRYETKITARVYENIKQDYSLIASKNNSGFKNGFYGKHHTEEAKQRISKANTGKHLTEEQCEKVRQSKVGKVRPAFTEEWLANIKEARQGEKNGMYGKIQSDETKEKIREKAFGRKQSDETIAKKVATMTGQKRSEETKAKMKAAWHARRLREAEDKNKISPE